MTNVCSALASTPPFAVPPLSVSLIVIVAVPLALAAGVYVRSPVALIAGPAEKRAAFVLLVTENVSVCPASFGGPARIAVAQVATVWAPASSAAGV
jgi:hypothetical protein